MEFNVIHLASRYVIRECDREGGRTEGGLKLVPDWRQKIRRSFASLRDEGSAPLFSPLDGMKFKLITKPTAVVPTTEEIRVLALKSYIVDEIEQVGDVWEGGLRDWNAREPFSWEAYRHYLRQMCQLAKLNNNNVYLTEQRRLEAEWRISVGDIEQDSSAKATRATPSWKEAYNKCLSRLHLQSWKAMNKDEREVAW